MSRTVCEGSSSVQRGASLGPEEIPHRHVLAHADGSQFPLPSGPMEHPWPTLLRKCFWGRCPLETVSNANQKAYASPERQRREVIPAQANGLGNRQPNKERAEGPPHIPMRPGLQPSRSGVVLIPGPLGRAGMKRTVGAPDATLHGLTPTSSPYGAAPLLFTRDDRLRRHVSSSYGAAPLLSTRDDRLGVGCHGRLVRP